MKCLPIVLLLTLPLFAATADCDISTQPAATLLLPYFDVDFNATPETADTTVFSITNVKPSPQIARVTIWTDLGVPALSFNLFLTGYDVQKIDLYDVLSASRVPATSSTSEEGTLSLSNNANPNILPSAYSLCTSLPGALPSSVMAGVRDALTSGNTGTCVRAGTRHPHAVGYATVDVMATCKPTLPTETKYFTEELLFDNVFIGEATRRTGGISTGATVVHLRAIPGGGPASIPLNTDLPYTFYDRYTPRNLENGFNRTADRRQPLPSTFAARFLQLPDLFKTDMIIWREGVNDATSCADAARNAALPVADEIRFDEHENPTGLASGIVIGPPLSAPVYPETSSTPTAAGFFPAFPSGDAGGWLYLNLNNGGSTAYSVTTNGISVDPSSFTLPNNFRNLGGGSTTVGFRPSQNWVSLSMGTTAGLRVEEPATAMRSGCVVAPGVGTPAAIEPVVATATSSTIAQRPAATLLLPYFQVDLTGHKRSTLLTILNTSASDRIAHVTLWNDWGYPAVDFDVPLTGHDVEAFDLFDVLNGTRATSCGGTISSAALTDARRILTQGLSNACGTVAVGDGQLDATGYATIDLVKSCGHGTPASPGYFDFIAFDNVLTGDYQQLMFSAASGAPLVHIRTTEGDSAHSFYETYTPQHRDRRQPLPSRFAARVISRPERASSLKVWRAPATGQLAPCSAYADNARGSSREVRDIIQFDEHENPTIGFAQAIPVTSLLPAGVSPFPPITSLQFDNAGWITLNVGAQSWVIVSDSGNGVTAEHDAAPLN
jgi:hypothetical protein